jgi:CRISPR-associated protein Csm1
LLELVKKATIGSLLHDVGKVVHRAGALDGRAHSISGAEWTGQFCQDQEIIDCIRFHHHQDLQNADLPHNHPAYAVYLADNISSGLDRREIEGASSKGFDKNRLLDSIYNLLHNREGKATYPLSVIDRQINYPGNSNPHQLSSEYGKILAGLGEGMKGIEFNEYYINSLIELCEAYLSFVPSSTNLGEVADISLFDHVKLTGAIAAAIILYLENHGRTDYQKELFHHRNDFYQEKAFALLSLDISGIQQFIYTISSKCALKALRARSFYLEILLENMADEILTAYSLSRTNLLYTGGGHAYILLPNVRDAQSKAERIFANANKSLMELFGARLFVAYGYQECSANELMSRTGDPESYSNIFSSVAAQIAQRKLRRYAPEDIRRLNQNSVDKVGRECSVCGVSSQLEEREEGTICQLCAAFIDISGMLIKEESLFAISKKKITAPALPLFSAQGERLFLSVFSEAKIKKILQEDPPKIIRIYSKNTFRTGLSLATKLWMGDYAAMTGEGDLKTFAQLADSSSGIKRLGVLRADVDNLGSTFVSGFQRENGEDKYRYVTISRTTTLSRSLSIFFKYYINSLLAEGKNMLLPKDQEKNLVIVYAGGDDLFLVGAWDEILSAALNIRRAFSQYTGDALTLSAGLAVFEPGYPISRMAEETLQLESRAKNHVHKRGQKNSLSLFGLEMDGNHLTDQHTYDWSTFEEQVLGEKYASIAAIFDREEDYGNSFLYNILYLLRLAQNDNINLARLAYLLARREPEAKASDEKKEAYRDFAKKIYQWAMDKNDLRQLITALMLYTYSRRNKEEEER